MLIRSGVYYVLFALAMFSFGHTHAFTQIVTVGTGGNLFSPAFFTINPGDTVRWEWSSGFHNTSSYSLPAGAPSWYANITGPATSFSYVASVSGLYNYDCTFRSGMNGQFFVTGCTYPLSPGLAITGSTIPCEGDTLWLSTASQPGASYLWLRGTTALPGDTNAIRVTTSGNYRVIVNRCGANSSSPILPVTFDPLPVPSFTYTASGGTYTFLNTTALVSSFSYRWIFSNGLPDQTSIDAVLPFPGISPFTATLEATRLSTGCTGTTSPLTVSDHLSLDQGEKDRLSVFPNPASAHLVVSNGPGGEYSLIDMLGRTYPLTGRSMQHTTLLDIRRIPDGVYMLVSPGIRPGCTARILVHH